MKNLRFSCHSAEWDEKTNRTGVGKKVSRAARVTEKAFAEWLVRALTLTRSPGFISSGRLLATGMLALLLVRAILPLERHLRSTAEGSLLQDELKHQHDLALLIQHFFCREFTPTFVHDKCLHKP